MDWGKLRGLCSALVPIHHSGEGTNRFLKRDAPALMVQRAGQIAKQMF
jgi:hypothetical protein